MKNQLVNFLFLALIVHLVISLFIILDLPFLRNFRPLTVYKTYLLPGPFFTDSKISDNHSFYVSWKVNGNWSEAINPAGENFNQYHSTLNPTDLYRARLSKGINPMFSELSEANIKEIKEFTALQQYLNDHYVPEEADSVQVWFINKRVRDFRIRRDSVQIIFSR